MFEKDYISKSFTHIAATDEVGRGPLAGPVVSACIYTKASNDTLESLTNYLRELGVTDSKKLTDKKREKILEALSISGTRWSGKIAGVKVDVVIDEKTPAQIDELNILQASLHSMRDAFIKLKKKSHKCCVLVDGNKSFAPVEGAQIQAIVKGDSKSSLIGLASIVAKVYRDHMMKEYAIKYPHYDFEKNAGYPTKGHREGIAQYGITPIHRKTFKGVKEYICEQNH